MEEIKAKPYGPIELDDMIRADPRLAETMGKFSERIYELTKEMKRMHLCLFAAIIQQGPLLIGPDELIEYKEKFTNFTWTPINKTQFKLDIERVAVAQEVPPDGTKDNKPIAQ